MTDLISNLWNDFAGKVFIITIASSLFGYLTLFGYISKFTGGKGGISFRSTEFSIIDILGLFPTILIALFEMVSVYIKRIVFYYLIPFFLSLFSIIIYASNLLHIALPLELSFLVFLVAISILLISFFISFDYDSKVTKVTFLRSVLKLLTSEIGFISIIISSESLTTSLHMKSFGSTEINAILLIILFPIIAYGLGSRMGEIAFKSNLLNSVSQIIATYPVFGWENERPDQTILPGEKTHITFLPNGKVMEATRNRPTEIFYFNFEKEKLFLISSFSKYSLFFIPEKNRIEGSAILVANEFISSIKFYKTNITGDPVVDSA
jgi:hypothetical protein